MAGPHDRNGGLSAAPVVDSADRAAAHQRAARLAAALLDVPLALVSVVDDERHSVRASTGLSDELRALGELPLAHSICQHVAAGGRPL